MLRSPFLLSLLVVGMSMPGCTQIQAVSEYPQSVLLSESEVPAGFAVARLPQPFSANPFQLTQARHEAGFGGVPTQGFDDVVRALGDDVWIEVLDVRDPPRGPEDWSTPVFAPAADVVVLHAFRYVGPDDTRSLHEDAYNGVGGLDCTQGSFVSRLLGDGAVVRLLVAGTRDHVGAATEMVVAQNARVTQLDVYECDAVEAPPGLTLEKDETNARLVATSAEAEASWGRLALRSDTAGVHVAVNHAASTSSTALSDEWTGLPSEATVSPGSYVSLCRAGAEADPVAVSIQDAPTSTMVAEFVFQSLATCTT